MSSPPVEQVWTPTEVTLRADQRYTNPYTDVAVSATFEHESGTRYEIPGFWDGDGQWRVRFAPTEPGRWTYEVDSARDDSGLATEGRFEAVASAGSNPIRSHGFLEPDGRRLVHDDGTPFFWLADTAWSAGAKASTEEWERYLTARGDQGFNVVQITALPQHDASKPWDRLPFGESWNLDDPDPAYFRALDDLVAMAHDRGFVPALVALWFNYAPGTWPDWDGERVRHPFDPEQAARFGRYLAARYGAYGPAWLVSGDTNYEADDEAALEVYDAAARAIGESVTHPLRASHMIGGQSTPERVADRDWLDFHCYQSGHTVDLDVPAELAADCRSRGEAPVINGEPPYERLEYHDTQGRRIGRETARQAAWLSVLAGANAGVTYGAHGVWPWHRDGERFGGDDFWGMPDPWDEALRYPGARDYGRLRDFCGRFAIGELAPRQDLLADDPDLVRAAELPADDAVVVYAASAEAVELDGATAFDDGSAAADVDDIEWIDPAEWSRVPASVESGGDSLTVAPPPWEGDGLLVWRR